MWDSYALFGALTRIESKRKTKNSTHQAPGYNCGL
jgi:hypothetical protein